MRKQYSDVFIEQALVKVYSRSEGRTIRDIAGDINDPQELGKKEIFGRRIGIGSEGKAATGLAAR